MLNDAAGKWIGSHGVNRYRDWDELRYSFRSLEKNAGTFRNNIQVLVNSIGVDDGLKRSQTPNWLDPESMQYNRVQVLAQEDYFDEEKKTCLPTFNSLTMENQIFNTPSTVDEVSACGLADPISMLTTTQMFTMSDDMLLTTEHAASDIHTPLFGPVMSFKTNAYNTKSPPTSVDAARFGEKVRSEQRLYVIMNANNSAVLDLHVLAAQQTIWFPQAQRSESFRARTLSQGDEGGYQRLPGARVTISL